MPNSEGSSETRNKKIGFELSFHLDKMSSVYMAILNTGITKEILRSVSVPKFKLSTVFHDCNFPSLNC